jgi:hypothetical protein
MKGGECVGDEEGSEEEEEVTPLPVDGVEGKATYPRRFFSGASIPPRKSQKQMVVLRKGGKHLLERLRG